MKLNEIVEGNLPASQDYVTHAPSTAEQDPKGRRINGMLRKRYHDKLRKNPRKILQISKQAKYNDESRTDNKRPQRQYMMRHSGFA